MRQAKKLIPVVEPAIEQKSVATSATVARLIVELRFRRIGEMGICERHRTRSFSRPAFGPVHRERSRHTLYFVVADRTAVPVEDDADTAHIQTICQYATAKFLEAYTYPGPDAHLTLGTSKLKIDASVVF